MVSLKHFDCASFLKNYWQKKPLLIRQALPSHAFTLTPDTLAGLACEENIESRLIEGDAVHGFQLSHGPFDEARFNTLAKKNWTLLVQAVDHVMPEVAALLEYFRFIPNWRIDDIMVSYAVEGGSAGPHYDNYDVFLIQGSGKRLWQVGPAIEASPELIKHNDLKLLKHFGVRQQWELQTGDILYLPPRYAHWGISQSHDCMTYSVGFRSPSIAELMAECCEQAIMDLSNEQRYKDSNLALQDNPGEITPQTLERMQQLVITQLANLDRFTHWIGCYLTEPKYSDHIQDTDTVTNANSLLNQLSNYSMVCRDSASRFAYSHNKTSMNLYVNGSHYPLKPPQPFIEILCSTPYLPSETVIDALKSTDLTPVILALFAQGSLYFGDELYD